MKYLWAFSVFAAMLSLAGTNLGQNKKKAEPVKDDPK